MKLLHDLAEDIVFVLIWKRILDIDRRQEAIRKVWRLLIVLSLMLIAGILTVLIFCIIKIMYG